MLGNAAVAFQSLLAMQTVLVNFESAFKFGAFLCPIDAPIYNVASQYFDYIVVGCGTAGSVLANRLSACPGVRVLVLEDGGCPRFEELLASKVAYAPRSAVDYNYTTENDQYSCQNLQGRRANLDQGKVYGGCSSMSHMVIAGNPPEDYSERVKATNNPFWSYDSFLPYKKRSENVEDKELLKEFGGTFGTKGPFKFTKEIRPENEHIIEAYKEIGYDEVLDTSNNKTVLGVYHPLLQIGEKFRSSGLVSYVSPVKTRPNLFFLSQATVFKIIFKNKVAIGVRFSYKNRSYTVYARTEVIISAGAFRTPQLLMLSGIGPAERLRSLGIRVLSNLPVGQNLQDQISSTMVFPLQRNSSVVQASNPFKYPTPMTTNFANLDNPRASFAQYQGINFVFSQNNPGLLDFFLNVFRYSLPIVQKLYEVNVNRSVLVVVPYILHPKSRGETYLRSTSINDKPIAKANYFTEDSDLDGLASFLNNTAGLVNTASFKSLGAEFFDFGLCSNYTKFSKGYWKCYALAMSCTTYHYCCTASNGPVVDNNFFVKGVKKLRVVDSSVLPLTPGGNPIPVILAMAEKMSDIILGSNPVCNGRINKCGC